MIALEKSLLKDYSNKSENTKAYVVNKNTGEITNELKPGDRIIKAESRNKFKKNKEIDKAVFEEWNIKTFYKANTSEMQLLMNDLSQSEKAFLFSIVPYISYDDSHLQYGNGNDIGTEDLIKITGMSRSAVYQIIDSLNQKDVIYKGKNSRSRQFFINPWLFYKGNKINKVLKTMFKNYKVRTKGNIPWKDLKGF